MATTTRTDRDRIAILEQIRELINDGQSQAEAIRQAGQGVTDKTLRKWATKFGIDIATPGNAGTQAMQTYNAQRRTALSDKLFAEIDRRADGALQDLTAGDLRALATAYAILVDKRRLEDGDVTDRTERLSYSAVDAEIRRLERELSERDGG